MSNTNPARGMRDFLPSDVRKRNYVIGIIKEVYESYGFEPLETPAVENIETLTGKYGEEGNQLIFKILKRGEKLDAQAGEKDLSDLALRYDLTVPLARVVANHKNDLPKFFKRYQIQPVWRADRPARGRFREFYQCDVDAIGSSSMMVEAELCAAVSEILTQLGFDDFVIRVNHRQILSEIMVMADVPIEKHTDALIALDKIDKIGREGVEKEFKARKISDESSTKLLTFFEFFIKDVSNKFFDQKQKSNLIQLQKQIKNQEDNIKLLEELESLKEKNPEIVNEKLSEIKSLRNWVNDIGKIRDAFNMPPHESLSATDEEIEITKKGKFNLYNYVTLLQVLDFLTKKQNEKVQSRETNDLWRICELVKATSANSHVKIDPTLARGLSYYTGAIFEINVPDLAGSLGGGGRYDGLIGMFGKEQIPACGFSLGLERILVVMEERGMFPPELSESSADVFVTVWNEESIGESLKLAAELREQKLRVLVYPEADKLGKQFKYADSIKIPFVCVLGESELAENKVTLKNLQTGEQETIERSLASEKIRQQ